MSNPTAETTAELQTEHIYIGDEFADQSKEPTTVERSGKIRNRIDGTLTELTFYEEGFLKVRESNKKSCNREHLLELRFLKPEPVTSRRIATKYLWISLAAGLLSLIASYFLPSTRLDQITIPAIAILVTTAVLGLLTFIYRAEVSHKFCTASGQAVVLSLRGSFGNIGDVRTMSGAIRQAILKATNENDSNRDRYLRAEMKAHYKLAETGVISREACSNGTALILAKFG
jgi:hypothetical protein